MEWKQNKNPVVSRFEENSSSYVLPAENVETNNL